MNFKYRFIEKYILPLFDPGIEYFDQYGIESTTVVVVPCLVILLIFLIKVKNKSTEFKLLFVGVILMSLAIIRVQFFK
jgi:hypothetical protein